MKSFSTSWLLSAALAFTGGWALGRWDYAGQPASVPAARESRRADLIQDKLGLSQGQTTATPSESQKLEFLTEPATEASVERLMQLPTHVLRKAYDRKLTWVEKRSIENHFWKPRSAQDLAQHRDPSAIETAPEPQDAGLPIGKLGREKRLLMDIHIRG